MFIPPIKHTRLTTMEELIRFSYLTEYSSDNYRLTMTQNNGQIAYVTEHGWVYVTPYRPEVKEVLTEAGYKERNCLFVPFSNGEKRPEAYRWLEKMAEEECWAYTFEEAYNVATEKGIKPLTIPWKCQVKEVTTRFDDETTHLSFSSLTSKFLFNESKENIGTYIIIGEKIIVICDEYGRTFLLKVKTVINDLVNQLLESGYKRCAHPERYVRKYEL